MAAVLSGKRPGNIPLWELKFHLWGRLSGKHFTYKQEYKTLSSAERERALHQNAGILAEETKAFHHSAVTVPSPPWQTAYELPMEDRPRFIRLLKECAPDLFVIASCGGVIGMPDAAVYEDFCVRLYEEPESIDEECERLYARSLEKMRPLLDAGVDAIYTPSDMADNHGPFFRSHFMERFVLPYLVKWAEAAHQGGARAILHTDGQIMPILGSLCETGIDGIQSVDSVAGMQMDKALDKAAGHVALIGNVDCGLLITGTPDEVYAHTREIIVNCLEKPGFVLGASNAVVEETPLENYLAMVKAYEDCTRR